MEQLQNFESVVYSLDEYDAIFQKLFSITKVLSNDSIPKSAVVLNSHTDQIELHINPTWFNSLDFNTKKFCFMHEMLHVILNHLYRASHLKDRVKANIAEDIVINHIITDNMMFERELINDWQQYWWIDTANFTIPRDEVEYGREFEYYYEILKDGQKTDSCGCEDCAEFIDLSDFFNSVEDAKNLFSKLPQAGKESYRKLIAVIQKKIINRKWNDIPLIIKYPDLEDEESWVRENYRIKTKDLVLPTSLEQDKRKKKEAWLFLDISGSCYELKHDFLRVANTIPTKKFIIRRFVFDTKVTEIKNNEYFDGGGTSFRCIANFIEHSGKYPDNIFVFTDGYGDSYFAKYPERWHWFLSKGGNTRLIDEKSKIYSIETLDEIRRNNS